MTSPVTVSERDLRTLLGIVGDHCTDLPAAGLPLSLLAELKDQIPCDDLSFFGFDSARQTPWFFQEIPADADDSAYQEAFWENYWDFEPCCYPDRTGDLRSVTKISDFLWLGSSTAPAFTAAIHGRWASSTISGCACPSGHRVL
jgi:hypothetical protein